jgi:hypothetical protein
MELRGVAQSSKPPSNINIILVTVMIAKGVVDFTDRVIGILNKRAFKCAAPGYDQYPRGW